MELAISRSITSHGIFFHWSRGSELVTCESQDPFWRRVQRCERRIPFKVFRKSRLLGCRGLVVGSLIPLISSFTRFALLVARLVSMTRALIVALTAVEAIFDSHEGLSSSHHLGHDGRDTANYRLEEVTRALAFNDSGNCITVIKAVDLVRLFGESGEVSPKRLATLLPD